MNFWSQLAAYFTLGLALLLDVWLYLKITNRYPKKRKPISQAFVLGSCVLAAMLLDEECLRFFSIPSDWEGVYRMSFAIKWEFAALFATLVITILYWVEERQKIRKVDDGNFWSAASFSVGAMFSLFGAFYFMFKMLFAPSRDALLYYFGAHFFCLILLSLCFLAADYFIWTGVVADQDPTNHLKNLSHLSVYLVDLPVFLSFLLLGLYCVIHKGQHSYFHFLHRYLSAPVKPIEAVNLWTAEEYFMSGAIAFQYLLSTAIYLILAFELFDIKPTNVDNQSEVARVESTA
jgi:hypothetical protein